jgi:hypothetical protein
MKNILVLAAVVVTFCMVSAESYMDEKPWVTVVADSTSLASVAFKEKYGDEITIDSVSLVIYRDGAYWVTRNKEESLRYSAELWSYVKRY